MSSEEIAEQKYSASNIQVLEGLEAVRKRPSMYIGDTSTKGLHHLVYEVVDNSIDEAMAGFATHIEVTITEDNSIKVVDNGRGIPVDMHEKLHKSALEVVLTVLHAGGKFDKGSYKVSGGLHGVGVSCVNALSTYLRAEVRRGGKVYMQEYSCGHPKAPVAVIGETSTDDHGTTIFFHPDPSIFSETVYSYEILATRLRDLAFLNAGVKMTLTDFRQLDEEGTPKSEQFYSQTGLDEFVRYIDSNKEHLINDVIHISTEKQGIPVEVAMTYNTSFNENIYSFVNNINTIEGGTHLTGFRRGLGATLKKYAEDNKLLEKVKVEISKDDFREGLTAVISVKVLEPQFEGQTKTKLGNNEAIGAVETAVREALGNYLEEHPTQAKAIIEKVILAATARHAAQNARMNVLRKSPLAGAGMPDKLADCKEHGSHFIRHAPVVVAVCGRPAADDCWIEDCAIAAVTMQYQAEELGLATCWVQVRGRSLADGTPSEQVVGGILGLPADVTPLCLIAIGHGEATCEPHDEDDLRWENIHINQY